MNGSESMEAIGAYGIFSGGLDSLLACRLLLDQGLRVVAITFETPFFDARKARRYAGQLEMEHRVVDLTEPHLEMMRSPRYGFGKALNPCIDCHALMLRQAGRIMEHEGGRVLFSGEVLGQRPMSQNRQSLELVERLAGYERAVLRPLSALSLEPTRCEREGWVDRERLMGIRGRGRKQQIALAARYGLDYPGPGGGCSLTEPNYARRLADLRAYGAGEDLRQIGLLKIGRHLRLSERTKLVVGRDQSENRRLLEASSRDDLILDAHPLSGPVAILIGGASPEETLRAARVVARYVRSDEERLPIRLLQGDREQVLEVAPQEHDWIEERLI